MLPFFSDLIQAIRAQLEIFADDDHKKRARKSLNKRIDALLRRLQQIADGDV